jgi:hypothetical protein
MVPLLGLFAGSVTLRSLAASVAVSMRQPEGGRQSLHSVRFWLTAWVGGAIDPELPFEGWRRSAANRTFAQAGRGRLLPTHLRHQTFQLCGQKAVVQTVAWNSRSALVRERRAV